MGGLFATAGALGFAHWPALALIPLMTALGFLGGALWALLPGLLRAAKLVNETISTLLLNYIAPLIVSYFHLRAVAELGERVLSANRRLSPPARGCRPSVRRGSISASSTVSSALHLRLGDDPHALGPRDAGDRRQCRGELAARRSRLGLRDRRRCAGRRHAGLAGMAEVSAIQGRLVASLSPGYGFMGFLVAWLAGGAPSASS